jgi:VWFA-related protein
LVQTDVMVFDKSGHFVDGIPRDQFELTLDGKPQTISFFDSLRTGTAREANRRTDATTPATAAGRPRAIDNGRVVFFFLDDVHMSQESIARSRQALAEFVDQRLTQSDLAAVVSTSGQIGFLQQVTDNETVLHEAIARLNYKRNPETYAGRTPITEYQANQAGEHHDSDLFNYLVSSTMNEMQLVPPKGGDARGLAQLAANNVANRVRQINAQSKAVTDNTLGVLMSLMRSSAGLPGRKLLCFITDGFITDARDRAFAVLKKVTALAAEVGVVVYPMDVRGRVVAPEVDASRNDFPDGFASGTTARHPNQERIATQEPLRLMADDTGGRAILNPGSILDGLQQAVSETAAYYLLAWRPETEDARNGRARLKVTVKDHPELRVRLRKAYYVPPAPIAAATGRDAAAAKAPAEPQPEVELLSALGATYPTHTLPLALSAGYMNTVAEGAVLKLSMQMERWAFAGAPGDEPKTSKVDVLGAAIDDRGVIVNFKQVVTVSPDPANPQSTVPVVWNQQLHVPPGLYQIRVAVRDQTTGRTGSAQQWVAVPDPAEKKLQLGSLFLAERKVNAGEQLAVPRPLMVDIDHRFGRDSVLRYQTYVYNTAAGPGDASTVEIQARVLHDGVPVFTAIPALVPLNRSKDFTGLPYWAELQLSSLGPGRYLLEVTATDHLTKLSSTQRVRLVVE